MSAVAINHNGQYVIFADKFGLVWAIALGEDDEGQAPIDNKAVPILGHYCSIITSLVRFKTIASFSLLFSIIC